VAVGHGSQPLEFDVAVRADVFVDGHATPSRVFTFRISRRGGGVKLAVGLGLKVINSSKLVPTPLAWLDRACPEPAEGLTTSGVVTHVSRVRVPDGPLKLYLEVLTQRVY